MFHVPNKYRIRPFQHPVLGSEDSQGNEGAFMIPLEREVIAFVIASTGLGWEHVSVHVIDTGEQETPTWEEMCRVKDLFWDEEDCVVQYHPPKSHYVNQHEHTLHLWKPTNMEIPVPDPILVGLKMKK